MIPKFKSLKDKIQEKANTLAEESYKRAEKKKIKVVDKDKKINKKNKDEQKTKKTRKRK